MSKEHEPKLNTGTGVTMAGRPWHLSFFLLLALGLALAFSMIAFSADDAEAQRQRTERFTQADTQPQSGFEGQADSAPINDEDDPFTFSRTQRIVSLDRVALVFRVEGDENFDANDADELTLVLDGIDTGLEAQVFDDNNPNDRNFTLVFFGRPDNAEAILAALKADDELEATLNDTGGNVVEIPRQFDTTLVIQGEQPRRR